MCIYTYTHTYISIHRYISMNRYIHSYQPTAARGTARGIAQASRPVRGPYTAPPRGPTHNSTLKYAHRRRMWQEV